MTNMKMNRIVPAAAALLALAACGGGSSNASTVQTVGSAGGTLVAGAATLSIPAGALTSNTQVTLREAEPRHTGRVERIEVEPHGMPLAQPARIAVKVDDTNAKVKMHDSTDALVDVEVEDRNHGEYKTSMSQLGEIEVELEHGAACTPACSSTQECDDGVCKAHSELEPGGTPGTATCNPACATGLECDNGVCKVHKGG